jgi:hypothetical protein
LALAKDGAMSQIWLAPPENLSNATEVAESMEVVIPSPSSLSDLGYLLVVARVRAFFTEAQNHEVRANMRYYKLNHPKSRPFLSPTGC